MEERLLVCVSPSPFSERLVRSGRRLAAHLDAAWYALYVETPQHARLPEDARDRVARTLRLAEALGGQALVRPGPHVAGVVSTFAREHDITQLVVGKPLRSRPIDLFRGSLVDQIVRASGKIDVYVISSAGEGALTTEPAPARSAPPWQGYLGSVLLVAGVTLLGQPLRTILVPTNLVMLYLLAVVLAALRLGRAPAILTAVLSVLAFNFFFIPPQFNLGVADAQHLVTFAGLLGVGLLISTLVAEVQEQSRAVERREMQAAALHALNRALGTAGELETVVQVLLDHLSRTFLRPAAIFLPQGDALLPRAFDPEFPLDEAERNVATWTYEHQRAAGRGTDTVPQAAAHYLPLRTGLGTVGVLGLDARAGGGALTREQLRLLELFAGQMALAIERAQLARHAREARLSRETEKLQSALLNSISHDLRTPLASITGALSSLAEDEVALTRDTRRALIATASEEAARLNRLVGNLLDMSRMEAGALRLSRVPCDVQDLVGVTLAELGPDAARVEVEVPDDLPLVPMDFVLMGRVLLNLLDNAFKYGPPSGPVSVRAWADAQRLWLEVADRGTGVPDALLPQLFDKFFRVPRADGVGGTGLGLSICRGIVEAHGGTIEAASRAGGGLLVTLGLPLHRTEVAT